MKWLLDRIYGADALGNPYYEFFVDAANLIPWWYPTLLIGGTAALLLIRWIGREQFRRETAKAALRVRKRAYQKIR